MKDLTPYENKTMEFKVIKLDRKRNNVVLSRRAVLEASMGEEREKLLATLKEGAVVNGIVKNITEYGAFVDLGGIDGLLHITDMAWRRVRHPSEVVHAGQELTAKVLKFDAEKNRVSLGLKQLVRRLVDERGLTVVLIIHDINLAAQFCDELIALKAGALCRQAPVAEMMRAEVLHDIFGVHLHLLDHPDGQHRVAVV